MDKHLSSIITNLAYQVELENDFDSGEVNYTDYWTYKMAVMKNGCVLQFALYKLQNAGDCELAAVQCTPLTLAFVRDKTNGDQSIAIGAVINDGHIL